VRTTTLVPSRPSEFSDMMDFICPAALKTPTDLEYKLASPFSILQLGSK
jgi:hypothetical protein